MLRVLPRNYIVGTAPDVYLIANIDITSVTELFLQRCYASHSKITYVQWQAPDVD